MRKQLLDWYDKEPWRWYSLDKEISDIPCHLRAIRNYLEGAGETDPQKSGPLWLGYISAFGALSCNCLDDSIFQGPLYWTHFRIAWRESALSHRKALKPARSDYFRLKLTKNKATTAVDISQQHSSNDFMNYFTSKIDTIRDISLFLMIKFITYWQVINRASKHFTEMGHKAVTWLSNTGSPE